MSLERMKTYARAAQQSRQIMIRTAPPSPIADGKSKWLVAVAVNGDYRLLAELPEKEATA
jgi:hypothetical protein